MQNNSRRKSIDGFITKNRQTYPRRSTRPDIKSARVSSPRPNQFNYYQPARLSPKTDQVKNLPKTKKSKRKIIKRTLLGTVLMIFILFGVFGYSLLSKADKIFHGSVYSDLKSVFTNTTLNGEAQGRVNILLAGYQGANSDEGALTDSIMVISIDTKNNTAFTMSIPRDLYLNVPGVGDEKINAANDNTNFNQAGYFKGGIGQLQKTIEQDLNIPINYYAVIDYQAFQDAVNAVGGINITINSPDPRGLYDPNVNKVHGGPVRLPNGPVHLNGLQALALALARGDSPYSYGFPLSDINRTQHQRQMLIALEQKALTAGVLTDPVAISKLFDAVGNNVTTDLSLPDVLKLAQLAHSIDTSNISSYGLSYGGTNPLLKSAFIAGQDSLIPQAGLDNFSQIQNYYRQITSSNPVVKEGASIVVLNAGNTYNLAHQEELALNKNGLNGLAVGSTSVEYNNSMLIDLSKGTKPATLKYLTGLLPKGTPVVTSASGSLEADEAQNYQANFILILGLNWNPAVLN